MLIIYTLINCISFNNNQLKWLVKQSSEERRVMRIECERRSREVIEIKKEFCKIR
jgi:hypothetical protein